MSRHNIICEMRPKRRYKNPQNIDRIILVPGRGSEAYMSLIDPTNKCVVHLKTKMKGTNIIMLEEWAWC